MTTDSQTKQIYTEIDALLPYQRYAAVIREGIDPLKYAVHRKTEIPRPPKPTYTRRHDYEGRRNRLKKQGGNCGLCETPLLDRGDILYESATDTVVCSPCQMVTSHVKNVMRRGVTLPMLIEWIKRFKSIDQSSERG